VKADKIPVSVCKVKGFDDRFFGKFKDTDGSWKKIPGGAYPPEVNTTDKALGCARRWYQVEMAERQLQVEHTGRTLTWPEVCDEFAKEVEERLRGGDGSRDEGVKKARFLRASPLLAAKPVAEHDEELALLWLRTIAREPIERKNKPPSPRSGLTVRNIAKILRDIYRFARTKKWFPREHGNPCDGDEFKSELSDLLSKVEHREVMCPVESVRAMLEVKQVPELRRVLTHVMVLTGLRPGELHGLKVSSLKDEGDVRYLDVLEQWTLKRGNKYPAKLGPLKTRWSKRKIPVHPSLTPVIDTWLNEGWRRHVGRLPQPDDFLFPDSTGNPFREERSTDFQADLAVAGCPTAYMGIDLTVYSLRHTFATVMKNARVASDVRDRLMGHRPKDTKALNYEVSEVPFLYEEMRKIPAILPALVSATKIGSSPSGPDRCDGDTETKSLVTVLVTAEASLKGPTADSSTISAEEEGFEPPVDFRPRRFSKPLP
jgi:integrase